MPNQDDRTVNTAGSTAASEYDVRCLGGLERELHASFHASRLPSNASFDHEFFGVLDEFVSEASLQDAQAPVLLVGPPGCGKSTLLAAWLQRRALSAPRKPAGIVVEEFIFVHVVGCTRQSLQVRELLTRLVSELVAHFDLPRPKNFDAERLAWDLPRLISAASLKGTVLLVIDGLHRLRNDVGEINLNWLPSAYPAHVRVVLGSTDPGPRQSRGEEDEEARLSQKIFAEVCRRACQRLDMTSLADGVRDSIVANFVRTDAMPHLRSLSKNIFPKKLHAGSKSASFLTDIGDDDESGRRRSSSIISVGSLGGPPRDDSSSALSRQSRDDAPPARKPFTMYAQQHALLSATATNSLALATYLRALSFSAARGYDVWSLQDKWLEKLAGGPRSTEFAACQALYDAVVETWEAGQVSTDADKARARRRARVGGRLVSGGAVAAGAPEALESVVLDAFAAAHAAEEEADSAGDAFALAGRVSLVVAGARRMVAAGTGTSVADLKWRSAQLHADAALAETSEHAGKDVDGFLRRPASAAKAQGRHALLALLDAQSAENGERRTERAGETAPRPTVEEVGDDSTTTTAPAKKPPTPKKPSTPKSPPKDDDDEYGDDDFDEEYADEDFENGDDDAPAAADDAPAAAAVAASEQDSVGAYLTDEVAFDAALNTSLAADTAAGAAVASESSEASAGVPVYLDGGVDSIPGVGMLLGDALALLYVARYGLREDELWTLLRSLDDDRLTDARDAELKARDGAPPPAAAHNEDEYAFLTEAAPDERSFRPELANELPMMLEALGVLHDTVSRVLVLPLESEALRAVVERRYIEGGPRVRRAGAGDKPTEEAATGADRWHARLAAHFGRAPPSRRRAEELPWHLKRCRRWAALCDTLAAVETFETMFHGPPQMRLELQAYWRLLVDGPLYTTNSAAQRAAVAQGALSPNDVLLSNLDTACALGLVESRARKERLADQAAPFDVVLAHNHAVEVWQQAERPTTHRLVEALRSIGEFLAGFADPFSSAAPPFLRASLDWPRLGSVGVRRDVFDANGAAAEAPSPAKRHSGAPIAAMTAAADAPADDEESMMKKSGAAGGVTSMSDLLSNVRGEDGRHGSEDSPLYYYERWLWIQFPWLALATATAVSWHVGQGYVGGSAQTQTQGQPGALQVSLDTSAAKAAVDAAAAAVATFSSGPNDRRYWAVKRQDPSAAPAHRVSEQRMRALSLAAVTKSKPFTAKVVDALKRDAAGCSLDSGPVPFVEHHARTQALNGLNGSVFDEDAEWRSATDLAASADPRLRRLTNVANRPPPRRMRLEPTQKEGAAPSPSASTFSGTTSTHDAAPLNGLGPFSYSSLRSQRRGTRFPSAEALIAEQFLLRSRSADAFERSPEARFGGTQPPADLQTMMALREAEACVERGVAASSNALAYLPAHAASFPATKQDVIIAVATARVARLRQANDKLVSDRDARKRDLEVATTQIVARCASDDHCARQLKRGERTLQVLDARLDAVRVALAEASALGAYYGEVVSATETATPQAQGQARLEVVARQLDLARAQAKDLLLHRRSLYEESERAAAVEVPRLKRDAKKWRSMRDVAVEKQAAARDTIGRLRDRLVYGPREDDDESRDSVPASGRSAMQRQVEFVINAKALARQHQHSHGNDGSHDDAGEAAATLMGQLSLAAASSDPTEIADKYRASVDLAQSLQDQHRAHVARSSQLRAQLENMRRDFSEMRLGGGLADSSADAAPADAASVDGDGTTAQPADGVVPDGSASRRVDAEMFKAEIRLHHSARNAEHGTVFLAELSSGVLHLAHLIEAYTSRAGRDSGVVPLRLTPDHAAAVLRQAPPGDWAGPARAEKPTAESPPQRARRASEAPASPKGTPKGEQRKSAVHQLLADCEETIMSVREVVSIDKQLQDDDTSGKGKAPGAKRETPPPPKESPPKRGKAPGDAVALNAVAHPALRVLTTAHKDDAYQSERRRVSLADRTLDAAEGVSAPPPSGKDAATFVAEGLGPNAANAALRAANMTSRLKQGPRAPLGLALRAAFAELDGAAQAPVVPQARQRGKEVTSRASVVTNRASLKSKSPS